jgi:hypothetical protein
MLKDKNEKKNQLKKLPELTSYTHDSGHETRITS